MQTYMGLTCGQCLLQAVMSPCTMPALICSIPCHKENASCRLRRGKVILLPQTLKRSSRVMPGLRGTPAGMMTTSLPESASPSCSSPAYPCKQAIQELLPIACMMTTTQSRNYLGDGLGIDVADISCHSRRAGNIIQGKFADIGVHLQGAKRIRFLNSSNMTQGSFPRLLFDKRLLPSSGAQVVVQYHLQTDGEEAYTRRARVDIFLQTYIGRGLASKCIQPAQECEVPIPG